MQNGLGESFWDAHGVRRDWGMRNFPRFLPIGDPIADREKLSPIGCSGTDSQKVFCFKLDAESVPEALETTILILLMFPIVLVHRRGTVARAPQPARERLLTTPGHLWPSLPPDVVT